MSAYASSLFLPPTTPCSKDDDENASRSKTLTITKACSSSAVTTTQDVINNNSNNNNEGKLSIERGTEHNFHVDNRSCNTTSSHSDTIFSSSSAMIDHCNAAAMSLYDITIKSVFIDPITFLTSSNSNTSTTKTKKNNDSISSTSANTTEGNTKSSCSFSCKSHCSAPPTWSEAMQFTLTVGIVSNGRRYYAKRDLASLFKFRDDLLLEQQQQRQQKEQVEYDDDTPDNSNTHKNHKDAEDAEDSKEEHIVPHSDNTVEIPHVPIESLTNQIKWNSQSIAQSFSGLQSAMKSYYPQVETWLRSIARIMPSSQVLSTFLYEPVNEQNEIGFLGSKRNNRMKRISSMGSMLRRNGSSVHSTLCSISESKDDEDDDF